MKPEYVIMVGNLFLKNYHDWDSTLVFTPAQRDAQRFTTIDEKSFKETISKLELYHVPYVAMKINITAEIQVIVPGIVSEVKEQV